MMTTNYLEILTLNGKASIQDLGRLNAQHLGFSVSGAADEHAYLYANKLIADHYRKITACNESTQKTCAALEITLGQITLRANTACTIAITGADCQVKLNETLISNWQCYQLQAGDIIDFAMPKNGLHSYLAILGGVKGDEKQQAWLGSFAQTENEMVLNVIGNKLKAGSKLFFPKQELLTATTAQKQRLKSAKQVTFFEPNVPELFYPQSPITLRFIASALFLQFPLKKQNAFLATNYVISPDSNRMGYRLTLKNESIPKNKILADKLRANCVLSKPVTYGMIQLPANEQPIILMKERQTMGGYPVLGSVMQTDLFRLSQMRPGQGVKFSLTSHQQAQQQLQAFYKKFI